MKITSYEQLNILVAQSLGWKEDIEYIPQDDFEDDVQVEYYHPLSLSEYELEDWFSAYGTCVEFSREWWVIEEFLLPECDSRKYAITWKRGETEISCTIQGRTGIDYTYKGWSVGEQWNTPRSMPLATCLAWLAFNVFNDYDIELDLPSSG